MKSTAINPENFTCTSWLSGKLSENIEINTSLPYVSIYGYFAQGEEADEVIKDINYIYNTTESTPLQAAERWAANML